jgi:cytochrome c oxidase cbb3-type subunit 3
MTANNLTALIVTLLLVPASLVQSGTVQSQGKSSISEKQLKQAKTLFKQACVRCHGSDGRGETTLGQIVGATDLSRPEWQERVDDSRLLNSITHGRGEMPAFGKKLDSDQIKLLTAYVRTLKINDVTSK